MLKVMQFGNFSEKINSSIDVFIHLTLWHLLLRLSISGHAWNSSVQSGHFSEYSYSDNVRFTSFIACKKLNECLFWNFNFLFLNLAETCFENSKHWVSVSTIMPFQLYCWIRMVYLWKAFKWHFCSGIFKLFAIFQSFYILQFYRFPTY